jgi:hypothetical protein
MNNLTFQRQKKIKKDNKIIFTFVEPFNPK